MRKVFCFLAVLGIGIVFTNGVLFAEETLINADELSIGEDGFVRAEGNVLVQRGDRIIKANLLTYDSRSNELNFSNIEEFYDGNQTKLSASAGRIDSDLKKGIVDAVSILIEEQVKIRANQVSLKNGTLDKAYGVWRITTCDECKDRDPLWHFAASSASRDQNNSNIIYRNVSLRIAGFPVAYIPYIRLPDPSVERAQGFLIPTFALSSNLKYGVKLPYFIPIYESSDLLVTPYISPKTKTIEYRYRQVFHNGNITLTGAVSDDDLFEDRPRIYNRLGGSLKLFYDLTLDFDIGQVSDNAYLGDYGYHNFSDFDTDVTLRKEFLNKENSFSGALNLVVDKEDRSVVNEYVAIAADYTKATKSRVLPGNFYFDTYVSSSANIDEKNKISRPPSYAMAGFRYNQQNFAGPIKLDSKVFWDANSFVNSDDDASIDEEIMFKAGTSLNFQSHLFKKNFASVDSLIAKLSFSHNYQNKNIDGDYFRFADELSFGNYLSSKKIVSVSESEKKLTVSGGIDYQKNWNNGNRLTVSFGAAKFSDFTFTEIRQNGVSNKELNYLTGFNFSSHRNFNISGESLINTDGNILKSDLRSNFDGAMIDTGGNFEFINAEFDDRFTEDLKNLGLWSTLDFPHRWKVNFDSNYDLQEEKLSKMSVGFGKHTGLWFYGASQNYINEDPDSLNLSVAFENNCSKFEVSFENRYRSIGNSGSIKEIAFRFILKPFADVTVSSSSNGGFSNSVF